jgi:dTDP-4-dehydrorhamnose reductase
MKILVTGIQGQLARALAERGCKIPGIEIVCFGRPMLDLAVPETIERIVRTIGPDVIVNAAAFTAVDDAESEPMLAERINAEAPGNLAFASREVGARIIQISTDYVFDGKKRGAYLESDAVNPLSVYGRTKLEGEKRAAAENPRHLILRTAWLYSPFGRNFIRTMLNLASNQETVSVVDDQHGTPTSAHDLADAVLQILQRWRSDPSIGTGQIYHLAGSGTTTWYGLARHMFETSRWANGPFANVLGISSREWPSKTPRPINSMLNCSKFAADFAWSAPPWAESVDAVTHRLLTELTTAQAKFQHI